MLVLVHAPELLRILMTASSATARFLSLAVLLLSLAPLASLYVVFVSLFGGESSSFAWLESGGSAWQNAAQALLKSQQAVAVVGAESNAHGIPLEQSIDWTQIANNRTALEEFLKTLYQEASKHQPHHPVWVALKELSPTTAESSAPWAPATAVLAQHWSIVIPWILTFILGVIVPMAISLWGFWCGYRTARRLASSSNTKRRCKDPMKRLQGFTKRLGPKDRVLDASTSLLVIPTQETEPELTIACQGKDPEVTTTTTSTSAIVTDNESSKSAVPPEKEPETTTTANQQWWLPLPGQRLAYPAEQARRMVPGSCVICLNAYQFTEKVSWSSNSSCVHCFHTKCISKWLSRQVKCPCCRRVFLTHENNKED